MPNINPDTGAKHKLEPLKTLKKERDVDKGYPGAACLGMNMVPVDKEGTVSVGDEVQVLERGETVYVPM